MADKLAEEREHRVIEPLLAGKDLSEKFNKDDMAYVLDLGLIRQAHEAAHRIANAICRDIIPRELGWDIRSGMTEKAGWYNATDGRLKMPKLLSAFQEFSANVPNTRWSLFSTKKHAPPFAVARLFLRYCEPPRTE